MDHVNVFEATFAYDDQDTSGYRAADANLASVLGRTDLTVRLFEIAPTNALCPYHYEYVEEWLLVLDGELELRTPAGTETLQRGALVCFPAGPDGAHKTTNTGTEPARIMMFSSSSTPAVAVYPDSGKVGVWTDNKTDEFMFARADAKRDYYDGEL